MSSEFDHVLKMLLIGDFGVGKSSLMSRFTDDTFTEPLYPIGRECKTRTIRLDGKLIKIRMFDTAGQKGFHLTRNYIFKGVHGAVIVYDVTDEASFKDLGMWLEQVKTHINKDINKLLVGNKCDLISKRQVDYATAKEYADKLGIPLMETSAKNGVNVELAFVKLVFDIMIKKRVFDQTVHSADNIPISKHKTDTKYPTCPCLTCKVVYGNQSKLQSCTKEEEVQQG